jgi:hypothetical protein
MRGREPLCRDWIGKTLAGVIGGFGLAIALSGLLACLTPGGITVQDKEQVVMWIVPPVWILHFQNRHWRFGIGGGGG